MIFTSLLARAGIDTAGWSTGAKLMMADIKKIKLSLADLNAISANPSVMNDMFREESQSLTARRNHYQALRAELLGASNSTKDLNVETANLDRTMKMMRAAAKATVITYLTRELKDLSAAVIELRDAKPEEVGVKIEAVLGKLPFGVGEGWQLGRNLKELSKSVFGYDVDEALWGMEQDTEDQKKIEDSNKAKQRAFEKMGDARKSLTSYTDGLGKKTRELNGINEDEYQQNEKITQALNRMAVARKNLAEATGFGIDPARKEYAASVKDFDTLQAAIDDVRAAGAAKAEREAEAQRQKEIDEEITNAEKIYEEKRNYDYDLMMKRKKDRADELEDTIKRLGISKAIADVQVTQAFGLRGGRAYYSQTGANPMQKTLDASLTELRGIRAEIKSAESEPEDATTAAW